MTTTAKIRAKGLSATGVTEDLAAQMFNTKGSRYMAIVELKVDEVHEKSDGDRRVDLVIAELEPVVDGDLNGALDEHVRDIWKALYENRLRTGMGPDAQLPLDPDDGPSPAVADIIQQGQGFVSDDDQDDEDDLEDDASEESADSAVRDPYTYVHSSEGAAPGADTACGLRATIGKSLHTNKDRGEVGCPECLSALDTTATASTVPNPFAAVPS